MIFNRKMSRILSFFPLIAALESSTFQDPANYSMYGGPSAHQVFQHYSNQMGTYTAHNLRAGASFEKLFGDAVGIRGKAAKESNTKEAKLFQTLRTKEEPGNAGVMGSLTPVLKYPYMAKIMRQNVKTLIPTMKYIPLDDIFEYRYMPFNARQWLEIIIKHHQTEPHIAASIHRLFEGKDGQGDPSTWVFDYKDGWVNGTLPMDRHFTNALLQSYQKAKQGIVDDSIKLIYVQIRFKGTDVDSRSIIFPTDATAKEDLSNVPFTLIHPSLKNMPYHMKQVEAAFEDARRAIGDDTNKLRRIAKFSYLFALTMPLVRGSAAVNEWLTSGLYLYHGLTMPKKMMDEIAQGSFTFEQFFKEFSEESQTEVKLIKSPIENDKTIMPKRIYEVVIARYNEDISWIAKIFPTQKVTVYNKGADDLILPSTVNIIPLDNVGRESHTYFTHIIQNYNTLSDAILFMSGNLSDHNVNALIRILGKDTWERFNFSKTIFGAQSRKANRRILIDEAKKILDKTFLLKTKYADTTYGEEYTTIEDFAKAHNINIPENEAFAVNFGAQFLVTKESIKTRGIDFYEKLLASVSKSKSPIEGHYLERLWDLVFNGASQSSHSLPEDSSQLEIINEDQINTLLSKEFLIFDSPFVRVLKDGFLMTGPKMSFKVLTKKLTTPRFSIKMSGFPTLTEKQLFIQYAIQSQGKIFKQGIMSTQMPYIEFEDDVKEDVQSYELLTNATQQNPLWTTFCINKIEFN